MKKLPFQFQVTANAENAAPAEISIRGTIGRFIDNETWSVSDTEEQVLNELNKIPVGKKINVKINSVGGDVGLALGCYNALATRGNDVTTINCGYACSSASFLMLAGARRVSPPSSVWMIHRASTSTSGNAVSLQKDVEMLKSHDSVMASIYAKRAGGTPEEWIKKMDAETWMTGEEAITFGLATTSGDAEPGDDAAPDAHAIKVVSTFKNIPENLRPRFSVTALAPATPPTPPTPQPQPKEKMKLVINALVAAGFKIQADADESAVVAAVSAIVGERDRAAAENKTHIEARDARVKALVESAITDKIVAENRKDALLKLGTTNESEVVAQIEELRASKAPAGFRGAPPAPKGSGNEPETLESLRAELNEAVKAEDSDRIYALTTKLRDKRGHGDMLKPEPIRAAFPGIQ